MTPFPPISPHQYLPMPPGAIIAFAGDIGPPVSTPPASPPASPPYSDYTTDPVAGGAMTNNIEAWGWMVCDGRLLYCSAYPQLFQVIGFLYNQETDKYQPGYNGHLEKDAEFRIPDYRGYFLRAVSGTAVDSNKDPVDPALDKRFLTNGDGNYGVGSIQQDALQNHWHEYTMPEMLSVYVQNGGTPAFAKTTTADTSPPTTIPSPPGTDPETIRTSKETRAKNFYVHYLIKYV